MNYSIRIYLYIRMYVCMHTRLYIKIDKGKQIFLEWILNRKRGIDGRRERKEAGEIVWYK